MTFNRPSRARMAVPLAIVKSMAIKLGNGYVFIQHDP